ncbi:Arc family DNA-binding protein [Mixta calida]|uniref:Arc family DNA-binding protein n=1 Tax=Mixta calida TaxID=665913 RepID=UPI002913B805|nr:Arc family DNA-binding protein [Mixta calida]MDU4288325.1 Arc family DNA-binding protein [Mixta calida]
MSERRYRNPQVNLRLPEELKERITKLAESNGRSANAEMVKAIEFWVSANSEMAENPEKYPIHHDKVEIKKDQLSEIIDVVRKQVLEHLTDNYEIVRRNNKKPT